MILYLNTVEEENRITKLAKIEGCLMANSNTRNVVPFPTQEIADEWYFEKENTKEV